MVGPISDAERSSFNRRIMYGVTLLVGASAGLVALQADPTPLQAVGAVVFGLVFGYPLARFVVPTGPAPATRQRQRQRERKRRIEENPFADGGDGDDDSDGANRSNGDGGAGAGSRSRDRGRR